MGRTNLKKLLSSKLSLLIAELLILEYQPERKLTKLKLSIRNLQKEIKKLLKENPKLEKEKEIFFEKAYEVALIITTYHTGIIESNLPDICPFDLESSLSAKLSSLRSQN